MGSLQRKPINSFSTNTHYLCQVFHFSRGGRPSARAKREKKKEKGKRFFPPFLALKVPEGSLRFEDGKNKTGKDGLQR